MKFKLTLPVKGIITQGFGENYNNSYALSGMLGHPAIDIVSKYDGVIKDAVIGYNRKYIYSFIHKDNPNLMLYRAVCQLVEADDGIYEVIYGHCNKITCQLGPTVDGQALATEGNTGLVYVGGVKVSAEEKMNGSTAGHHVHFQVRRVKKVSKVIIDPIYNDKEQYLTDENGMYFDTPNYHNGYHGCIDPMQFVGSQNNYKFTRELEYGSSGTDVYELQKRLIRLGFGYFTPATIFGNKTKQAVIEFQLANGIEPVGRVGPITKKRLNEL